MAKLQLNLVTAIVKQHHHSAEKHPTNQSVNYCSAVMCRFQSNSGTASVEEAQSAQGTDNNNNNICLLKIDKPKLNTEMLKVKVLHT